MLRVAVLATGLGDNQPSCNLEAGSSPDSGLMRKLHLIKRSITCLALLIAASAAFSQGRNFSDWPAGTAPTEVGKRIAEHFIPTPHMLMSSAAPDALHYAHVATWYGALSFAKVAGDNELSTRLVARFDPLLGAESRHVPPAHHVDTSVFGVLPLELYIQTRRFQYRQMGLSFADGQWDRPQPDGLTNQTRYWIDDMFMITALQVQAYRATADRKYLNRAADQMVAYLKKLQRPNGLFFHTPDVHFFWGRGNGWVAAGMAELLRDLPATHRQYKPILSAYRKMMATLLANQAPSGMWRQLIDHPDSWEESSSSAMFTFAFVSGVKNGWLPEDPYGAAARKAWIALVGYLTPEGDLREVCAGTGAQADEKYYYDRPRIVGDAHGQASMLWAAAALLR